MTAFLITLASLLWIGAFACLFGRQILAPALSFLALLAVSFIRSSNAPLLPLNNTILFGWLAMTVVVMVTVMLQPEPLRLQTKGMGFFTVGSLTGLAVGLLAFSVSQSVATRYAWMVVCTAAGIFLGALLYSLTPGGRAVSVGSGNFFRYLLAKGFPTAITAMQLGVALVLVIALAGIHAL